MFEIIKSAAISEGFSDYLAEREEEGIAAGSERLLKTQERKNFKAAVIEGWKELAKLVRSGKIDQRYRDSLGVAPDSVLENIYAVLGTSNEPEDKSKITREVVETVARYILLLTDEHIEKVMRDKDWLDLVLEIKNLPPLLEVISPKRIISGRNT